MTITKANLSDLDVLTILFDNYRIFYKQVSNKEASKAFLLERLTKQDSVIYIASIKNTAVGFTQLYPLFSSVSMQPMYLLNDLFIDANYRNQGIGKALIDQCKTLCVENKLKGLAIQTEHTNPAQYLYQRLGFNPDPDLHFFWPNIKN